MIGKKTRQNCIWYSIIQKLSFWKRCLINKKICTKRVISLKDLCILTRKLQNLHLASEKSFKKKLNCYNKGIHFAITCKNKFSKAPKNGDFLGVKYIQ